MRTPAPSETAPDALVASPLPGSSRLRRTLDRVQHFLFGHDIFISYARSDAIDYAQGLADALIQRRIAAYVDQLGTPPGPRLPPLLFLRLLRSSMLVLIGSPKAAGSPPVRREVEEFTRRRDRVFVIDVEGALDGVDWYRDRIKGGPARIISHEELRSGTPSEAVVNRIVDSIDFATRERRLRRTAKYTAAGILLAIVVALVVLRGLSQEAEAARSEATHWQSQADSAQQEAGTALQQKTAAERLAEQAEQKGAQAESLRLRADSLADLALQAEAAARASAEEQRRIARALNLASQAASALDKTGEGLVRSVLLAVESLKLAWTPEGFGAWVRGMDLLPPRPHSQSAHSGEVSALAGSSDGRRLASGSSDGTAVVWEAAEGRIGSPLRFATGAAVRRVALDRDGRWLLTSSGGRDAQLWRIPDGHRVRLPVSGDSVIAFAFNPDGRVLAIASRDTVTQLFELEEGTWHERARLPSDRPVHRGTRNPNDHEHTRSFGVAFSPDGRWLATAEADGFVLWSTSTLEPVSLQVLPGPDRRSSASPLWSRAAVAFSPDGQTLASAHEHAVRLWEIRRDAADSLQLSERATWQPHGQRSVVHLGFSPDSRYLATVGEDSTARSWEVSSGREIARHPGVSGPVAFSAGAAAYALATGHTDATVRLWPLGQFSEVRSLPLPYEIGRVAFSPDNRWLVAGGGRSVTLFEVSSWREVQAIEGSYFAFSPAARWLVAIRSGEQDAVQVFETANWWAKPPLEVGPDYRFLSPLSFSPDGRWLATRSRPRDSALQCHRETQVWSIATGTLEAWRGHNCDRDSQPEMRGRRNLIAMAANWPAVLALATGRSPFGTTAPEAKSADGHWSAFRSSNATATLQEPTTGRMVAELRHNGFVTDLVFSPDGLWLATASADSTVRLWPVSPRGRDLLIAAACARLPRQRLTDDEWRTYVSEGEPRQTCPHRPE
jgi:WD40 repeat protein